MADSAKDRALFQQWITSPAAGYCRHNPDGSRYDWAAEERKRKQEPAAWLAFATDGSESSAVYATESQARAAADEWNWDVAPLYARPMLADADRDALRGIAEALRRLRVYPEQLGRTQQDDVDLLFRIAGV